ncbi:hypothetical protein FBULB1_11108 [Fusarium bulbicola]|nr:hypothetical protein FBULB1_11108 [Fusarium bulbicola]
MDLRPVAPSYFIYLNFSGCLASSSPLDADMATNAQLVPEAKSTVEPPIRKPKTLDELKHIAYQYLCQHTQPCALSSWRAMVSVCDRIPCTMNLIINHLTAMDEGDPMKEAYCQEMRQKAHEFCSRRKGNEPTIEILRDRYGLSIVTSIPRPKRPEDVKEFWPPRRKRVFLCKEPECELSATKNTTKKALQQHINEKHTKPREGSLESAQENPALAVGPGLHGRELTTGDAANLLTPSSNASSTSVPYTAAQNGTQSDQAHRSGLSTNLGKRDQPQQMTSRGVRDGRISRPSTTNKRPLRDIRAKLPSKEFEA